MVWLELECLVVKKIFICLLMILEEKKIINYLFAIHESSSFKKKFKKILSLQCIQKKTLL
jgi:hypothetical protein